MIQYYTKKILLIFPIIIMTTSSLFSQLPGWRTVIDRDGNRFYIDTRGKIWTSGHPGNSYHIVSADGLDYYLNQGIELIRERHIPEGLTLLKSVLALPRNDDRIFHAQSRAAAEINRLKRREGQRFQKYEETSSLLLTRADSIVTITNTRMKYSLTIPFQVTLIRKKVRQRYNYRYSGILFGIIFKKPEPGQHNTHERFDALLAIDSEEFKSLLTHVKTLEKHRENLLGRDMYTRTSIQSKDDMSIYRITAGGSFHLHGFEGYFIKEQLGHLVRIVAPEKLSPDNEKKIILFLRNVKY